MKDDVIKIANLTRRFGNQKALDDVTLKVEPGIVFGLVGENGAGKTTLIKHLLGLLRAQTGTVSVFDLDPVKDPPGVLGKIGYLSEDRDLPEWMRVGELMRYTQAFYPGWDRDYARELVQTFRLDEREKIKRLSRGKKAQAALLTALAHRPQLLVLDEPSSGLDPVVRRDILGAIIRTVADEGRTVFFSSHLLDEVERVADQVAMIHHGRIILRGGLWEIKNRYRTVDLHYEAPPQEPPELPGMLSRKGRDKEWTLLCMADPEEIKSAANQRGAIIAGESTPTLEEIFVAKIRSS